MTEEALAWITAISALAGLIVVLVRVGNVSGRLQSRIDALEKDHEDAREAQERAIAEVQRTIERVEQRLGRELGEIKQTLAEMRRELRDNTQRLETRWQGIAERVTGLEEWRKAGGRNGL